MDLAPQSQSDASGDPAYAFKPSLFGAPLVFRLAPAALEWSRGRSLGRVPYDRIRRLRLSFRPVSMQSQRFVAEVWPVSGSKLQIVSASWRGIADLESQNAAYTAFITELHRRIAAAGAAPRFEAGASVVVYWVGWAVFAGVAVALAALTARALQVGANMAVVIIAGFATLFAWQMGTFLRRNRPGTYRADALPPQLLP